MALVQRALSFIFTRQDGTTFPNGSTSITIPPGLMAQVRITNAGLPGMGGTQTSIWGLTQDVMNQLSTLGIRVTLQPRNYVKIIAQDAGGSNTSTAFAGAIRICSPDFNRQPDPCLSFQAYAGVEISALPPKAQGYDGGIDVITVLQNLCKDIKYTLEPNGVSGVSITHYSWGDPRTVISEIRSQILPSGYDIEFDIQSQTVAIWSIQKGRGNPGGIPLVSAGSLAAPGTLIGYPSYSEFGIDFRCIYTPMLRRGSQVQVDTTLPLGQTSLPSANGLWNIYSIAHALDAQIPGGKWETMVQASRTGFPNPLIVAQPGTT